MKRFVKHAKEYEEKVVRDALTHEKKVKSFKGTTQVKDLHSILKHYFSQRKSDPHVRVTIVLEDVWGKHSLWLIEELVKNLFNLENNQHIQWFSVEVGSLIVVFLAPKYLMTLLIVNAAKKTQFMRRIGVISLHIGNICVLKEKKKITFTFENSLIQAAEDDDIEAVQFLLQYTPVNINAQRAKVALVDEKKIAETEAKLESFRESLQYLIWSFENLLHNALEEKSVSLQGIGVILATEIPYFNPENSF